MQEDNKTIELKDEVLEKVSGGWRVDPPDCSNFLLIPSHDLTNAAMKDNQVLRYTCRDCSHFQAPEGPCEYNLTIS